MSALLTPPPPPKTTAWLGGVIMGLPQLTGPFAVGVADIERRHVVTPTVLVGDKAMSDTLLCRLYYPAAPPAAAAPAAPAASTPKAKAATTQAPWLPNWRYAVGYGTFMKFPRAFSYGFLAPVFKGLTLPGTVVDAPLAPHPGDQRRGPFPLLVFSHGIAGMRTTYSNICSEIASNGYVVVAVEHGDYSSCTTLRENGAVEMPLLPYADVSSQVDEFKFRNTQVKHRIDEVFAAVELLKDLNDGKPINNVLASPPQATLDMFKGRLDLSRLSVGGHSFGGGTAVGATADPRSTFKACLALDSWMFPLGNDIFSRKRTTPVLYLNSEIFQWEENLVAMRKWVRQGPQTQLSPLGKDGKERPSAVMGYIRGTRHQNQSDFPLFVPSLMKMTKMAGPLPAETAIHLNNRACLTFLGWHAPDQTPDATQLWHDVDVILDRDNPDRPQEIVLEPVESETVMQKSSD